MQILDLKKFVERCNPFRDTVWFEVGETPITREEVTTAIEENRLREEPCPEFSYGFGPQGSRQAHVERVAYLAVHGWTDAIQIDLGVPSLGCHVDWPVIDGNHRLAAALFRGDSQIEAGFSGDVCLIEELILEETMSYPYEVGARVCAQMDITEGGDSSSPDPAAEFPQKNYVHAREGDLGTVEHISEDDVPTVRFERTGTATIVMEEEIALEGEQAFGIC